MTMNTRQAGAFTELIKKEEAARERWNATHGATFAARNAARTARNSSSTADLNASFGGSGAFAVTGQRPQSARAYSTNDLYNNAVSIGSPRPVDASDPLFTNPQTVTKRVVRQVEVPFRRLVRVPVKETKIVEVQVPKKVLMKKLVETDRNSGQKKYREVEEYVTVNVPEQRTVEVDGVRVDEVEETKLVEVEEYLTYQLKPVPTGQTEVINTREIGTARRLSGRRTGQDLFRNDDPSIAHLTDDDRTLSGRRFVRPASAPRAYSTGRYNDYSARNYTNEYDNLSSSRRFGQTQSAQQSRLGFKVRTSTTAPGTCTVFEVEPGQIASRAGLKPNDIILSTNGRQTNSLLDFKNAVSTSKGPLLLQVKRGTDRFVVTLQR